MPMVSFCRRMLSQREKTVHPRQHHIHHRHIVAGIFLQQLQGLLGAFGLVHLAVGETQVECHQLPDGGSVLHHQYLFGHNKPSFGRVIYSI